MERSESMKQQVLPIKAPVFFGYFTCINWEIAQPHCR